MNSYKKLFLKYQSLGISMLLFLGILAGTFLGIIPAIKTILAIRNTLTEATGQVITLEKKESALSAIDENTFKEYLSDLSLAVPTDKSLTSLFATIDGLGSSTGVTLSDFTLTKPGSIGTESAKKVSNDERKSGSNLLPFTLTVSGSYEQIRKFIEESIQVRRFFRIRYFSINFDQKESFSVNMGMDAFYAPLPSSLGSASQPVVSLSEKDLTIIEKIRNFPVLGRDSKPVDQASESQVETIEREDPFSL